MSKWKNGVGAVLVLSAMLASTDLQAGPKIGITDTSWVKISMLGQLQYRNEEDAAAENDFYMRRGRLIFAGQMREGIQFFMDTDSPNAGKYGTTSSSIYIQDIFADFRLLQVRDSELWAATGLILLPFSFESKASAASLLGNDYNTEAIKLVNDLVWRDYGIELHGNIGQSISARVGVFDGYDKYATSTVEKNPAASMRVTGHVAVNLIGAAETGSFYTQERLGKGDYLSIGAGIDSQGKATRTLVTTNSPVSVEEDSDAWVVDLQSGFNLGELLLTLNGAYYNWDNAGFKGNTMFVEAGVKYDKAAVTGKFSVADPDGGEKTSDTTVGLHYFFDQHNARTGVEYRWGDNKDLILASVQFLL